MIADVDHSKVIASGVIDSPVLGKISPTGLSGGVKTLILIANKPEQIFNATNCGDNYDKATDKTEGNRIKHIMALTRKLPEMIVEQKRKYE